MQYENTPVSENIEDRRGQGGGGMGMGSGGLGIGAIIVIFAISYFTGISPQVLMGGAEMVTGANRQQQHASVGPQSERPDAQFSCPRHGADGSGLDDGAAAADGRPICARDARHL